MKQFAEVHPERIAAVARVEAEASQLEDVADAIHLLILHLTDLVGAEATVVDLERDGSLISCYSTAAAAQEIGRVQEIEASVSGYCFSVGGVLRTPNIRRDPRFTIPEGAVDSTVSMISVPLHVHGPAVGLVRVLSSTEDCFDDEDLSIARMMTGAIARVLMHAVRREIRDEAEDQQLLSSGNHTVRFADRRKAELRQSERYGYPVSILMCRLKGYVAGEVLQQVSALVRSTDECFRLDAADFAILMPGTSLSDASKAGARLGRTIETAAEGVRLEWEVRSLTAQGWDVA